MSDGRLNVPKVASERIHNIFHKQFEHEKLIVTMEHHDYSELTKTRSCDIFKGQLAAVPADFTIRLRPKNFLNNEFVNGYSTSKKAKIVFFTYACYGFFFWECYGIFFLDHLEKSDTILQMFIMYCMYLYHLKTELSEKPPWLVTKKTFYHHDNAPAHSYVVAVAQLVQLGFNLNLIIPKACCTCPFAYI